MNDLINDHPRIVEVDALLAQVDVRHELFRRSVLEDDRRHKAALEEHHAEVERALAEGELPTGQKPQLVIALDERQSRGIGFESEKQNLWRQRRLVLAEIREEIEAQAREIDAEVRAEARELVEQLRVLADRERVAQQAMTEVASAQAAVDGEDPKKGRRVVESPEAATPETLVHAVLHGTNLLAVGVPRKLGVSASNLHAAPESAWEPPVPPEPERSSPVYHDRMSLRDRYL